MSLSPVPASKGRRKKTGSGQQKASGSESSVSLKPRINNFSVEMDAADQEIFFPALPFSLLIQKNPAKRTPNQPKIPSQKPNNKAPRYGKTGENRRVLLIFIFPPSLSHYVARIPLIPPKRQRRFFFPPSLPYSSLTWAVYFQPSWEIS